MKSKAWRKNIALRIAIIILALLLVPAVWLPVDFLDLTKPTITEHATVNGIDPKYGIYFITETGYEIQTCYQQPPHRIRGGETGELTYRGSIPLHFAIDEPIPLYFTNDDPSRSMSLVHWDFFAILVVAIKCTPAFLLALLLLWFIYMRKASSRSAEPSSVSPRLTAPSTGRSHGLLRESGGLG